MRVISEWKRVGLPLNKLIEALEEIQSTDDALDLLVQLLEDPPRQIQAEMLLRVVKNGSYKSAFKIMDLN